MASSSQSERKGLKEDQETESSISKTIQRVGGGGAVEVELGLDGGPRGEGLADEKSFRRTSRDEAGMRFSRAPPYSCSYGWVEENRRQDGVQGVSRKLGLHIVAPSLTVFGRGELVMDRKKIAMR
ncbi:hypothetical protein B296_00002629 [Ensete ventricosum]|uniref:Uncharacterized protein n=1 Tax=Ensete ventricosum TaxID=4639 RepID=A0A427A5F1_ENSVE|nr:hypothetical protein B296_00002629 [Ensete ventricosum]